MYGLYVFRPEAQRTIYVSPRSTEDYHKGLEKGIRGVYDVGRTRQVFIPSPVRIGIITLYKTDPNRETFIVTRCYALR